MMNTPIVGFVKEYSKKNMARLHMPGHKGKAFLGCESLDITEIEGADVLYSSKGIIRESESNAAQLFGTARTLYSCQGTSLSIRAMLYLALLHGNGNRRVLAMRNAHKVFMTAVTLLDIDVEWLCNENDGVISCSITPDELEKKLSETSDLPVAFYCTSPDYLGNIADLKGYARVCRKYGVLLLCDNAHGAYLNFLPESCHPIALGAHMCCDSAHKTLPVLTGGGYLHISKDAPTVLCENADRAMSTFSSTSPSYLVLQSLDMANAYISDGYPAKLSECVARVEELKNTIKSAGFELVGNEGLKLTLTPKSYGYSGYELGEYLFEKGAVCEFADPDHTVMMFTPETDEAVFGLLKRAFLDLPKAEPIKEAPPHIRLPMAVVTPRTAAFSPSEEVSVEGSEGRILASENVSCPPAIPIAVCGEMIDCHTIALFKYYGIEKVRVIKGF